MHEAPHTSRPVSPAQVKFSLAIEQFPGDEKKTSAALVENKVSVVVKQRSKTPDPKPSPPSRPQTPVLNVKSLLRNLEDNAAATTAPMTMAVTGYIPPKPHAEAKPGKSVLKKQQAHAEDENAGKKMIYGP